MRVRVGCKLTYESQFPTPMMLAIHPPQHYHHTIIEERQLLSGGVSFHEYTDGFGNRIWRTVAPVGTLEIGYDAVADVPPTPDAVLPHLRRTAVEDLPDEVIVYTLPSRHCQSDLFINDAWALFGQVQDGWLQVQAVCDWLHSNVAYCKGSTSSTTGWDAYQQRQGVCRDFAHLGVSFCRALNYPARYVCGYLPEINVVPDPAPMDFHAWFEVFMDGSWHTFDARHNIPRTGRVLIGSGRDAIDVALATIYGGAQMTGMEVWAAQVEDDAALPVVAAAGIESGF